MKKIKDKNLLEYYIEKFKIEDHFDTEPLNFELYSYDQGEVLNNAKNDSDHIKFIVSGCVNIYHIHYNGELSKLCILEENGFLGDLEFCSNITLPLIVEAHTDLLCVTLNITKIKDRLLKDSSFLQFTINCLAEKLATLIRLEVTSISIEERLMGYLKHEASGHAFTGVDDMATKIRCSRRQLQRVLKDMTDNGTLVKLKKGSYKLADNIS